MSCMCDVVFVYMSCNSLCVYCSCVFFFFKQKTAYEMRISDWSSDVCSSDLVAALADALKKAERELAEAKKALALSGAGGSGAASGGPEVEEVGGTKFLAQVVDGLDPKGLRGAVDEMKKQVGSGVAMLVAVNDGRASVAVDRKSTRLNSSN